MNLQTNTKDVSNTTKASTFKSLDFSSKPNGVLTISEALNYIKNNPLASKISEAKLSGKYNPSKSYPKYDYKLKKSIENQRNLYEYVKGNKCLSITWNCLVEKTRTLSDNLTLNGYMYLDFDDFSKMMDKFNISKEEAIEKTFELLKSRTLPFIKAVWKSFGGNGFGCIISVKNLSKVNFKTTWNSMVRTLSNFNLIVDPATHDITRLNVLPHDQNIFIRLDNDVKPFQSVEPTQLEQSAVESHIDTTTDKYKSDLVKYIKYRIFENYDLLVQTDGIHHDFIKTMAFLGLRRGISQEYLLGLINEASNLCPKMYAIHDFHYFESSIDTIYNRYSEQYGDSPLEVLEKPKELKVSFELNLKSKAKLSTISEELLSHISQHRITIIQAGTGTGKTHFAFKNTFKRVLLVTPNITTLKNNVEAHGCAAFYQDSKDIKENPLVCVTYASLFLLSETVNIEERFDAIFFDEAHYLAYADYMNVELNKCLKVLNKIKKLPIIGMTATPVKFVGLFWDAKLIKVTQDCVKPVYTPIMYDSSITTKRNIIVSRISNNKAKGKLSVLHINNTKEELSIFVEIFKILGFNIALVNSKVKDTEDFENICKGEVNSNCDVLICTSIMESGLSILNEFKSIEYIMYSSTEHPLTLKQLAARFRNVEDITLVEFIAKKEEKEQSEFFITNFCSIAKKQLDAAKQFEAIESQLSNNTINLQYQFVLRDKYTNELCINEVQVMNEIFKEETKFYNNNRTQRIQAIKKIGFEVSEQTEELELAEISQEIIVKSNEEVKKSKEIIKKSIDFVSTELKIKSFRDVKGINKSKDILSAFKSESKNQEFIDFINMVTRKDFEKPIYLIETIEKFTHRVSHLQQYVDTVSEAVELLKNEIGVSDKSFELFLKTMKIRKLKNSEDYKKNIELSKFVKKIYQLFELNKLSKIEDLKQTYLEASDELTKNQKKRYRINSKISNKEVIKQLKTYFKIQNKRVGEGKERETQYILISQNPYNLDVNKTVEVVNFQQSNIEQKYAILKFHIKESKEAISFQEDNVQEEIIELCTDKVENRIEFVGTSAYKLRN